MIGELSGNFGCTGCLRTYFWSDYNRVLLARPTLPVWHLRARLLNRAVLKIDGKTSSTKSTNIIFQLMVQSVCLIFYSCSLQKGAGQVRNSGRQCQDLGKIDSVVPAHPRPVGVQRQGIRPRTVFLGGRRLKQTLLSTCSCTVKTRNCNKSVLWNPTIWLKAYGDTEGGGKHRTLACSTPTFEP